MQLKIDYQHMWQSFFATILHTSNFFWFFADSFCNHHFTKRKKPIQKNRDLIIINHFCMFACHKMCFFRLLKLFLFCFIHFARKKMEIWHTQYYKDKADVLSNTYLNKYQIYINISSNFTISSIRCNLLSLTNISVNIIPIPK